MAAEVHHGVRGHGRGLRQDWRLVLVLVVVVVVLGGAGGDAVLGQELFQVHVLELEVVPVVRQGLVPQRGAQEGGLRCAALLLQVLLLLLLLAESCTGAEGGRGVQLLKV